MQSWCKENSGRNIIIRYHLIFLSIIDSSSIIPSFNPCNSFCNSFLSASAIFSIDDDIASHSMLSHVYPLYSISSSSSSSSMLNIHSLTIFSIRVFLISSSFVELKSSIVSIGSPVEIDSSTVLSI